MAMRAGSSIRQAGKSVAITLPTSPAPPWHLHDTLVPSFAAILAGPQPQPNDLPYSARLKRRAARDEKLVNNTTTTIVV
jgi:hypothetical protein